MTTGRETMLQALDLLAKTALEGLTPAVTYLTRNAGIASQVEGDQDITVSGDAKVFAGLKDGDALEPEALLGSSLWDHGQGALLELAALHPDADKRDAALDAALVVFADALAADPTLGGTCNYAQAQAPQFSTIGDPDAPMGKAAELVVEVLFTTGSSIG